MHIHSASSAPAHPSPSAAARPPAQPFSHHVARKSGATAHSGSAPRATAPAAPPTPASGAATAPPGAVVATAPGANAASTSADPSAISGSLSQSQDQNMQFLELQSQMDTQSEMFTAMSNVEKAQTDTLKNTAQNMAI